MKAFRVRFAPSPTGALHIGGIRTALYNYALAKQQGGSFILRIEDTDQVRLVEGAEDYIIEALRWVGLHPDEGPGMGGDYGPYRQSDRKEMYGRYALQLIQSGHAYYAFDSVEELEAMRVNLEAQGVPAPKYNGSTRNSMRNSLTMSSEETNEALEIGTPYVVRLKVPADEQIHIQDLIRGHVVFDSNELDDKVILKADGMPTYHLANIVDDHLMEISHVIRGEEWLSSTAHHVLLYRFLGWEDTMPSFAHLPLILKPSGNGKLSKRDGTKLGIPVFPLSWDGGTAEESFQGFREAGFDPRAVLNFLALLGWNPGTEQEIFSLEELCAAFSLEKIHRGGARFDYEKAKWFNQQYIHHSTPAELAAQIKPLLAAKGLQPDDAFLGAFAELYRERVTFYKDFYEQGYYFFEPVRSFDTKTLAKKWLPERKSFFEQLKARLADSNWERDVLEAAVKEEMGGAGLGPGDVFPVLRIALTGILQGPDLFATLALMGPERGIERLTASFEHFDGLLAAAE